MVSDFNVTFSCELKSLVCLASKVIYGLSYVSVVMLDHCVIHGIQSMYPDLVFVHSIKLEQLKY